MIEPVFPVRADRVAAPGTIAALYYALADRVTCIAAAFWGDATKGGSARAPVIFPGWVPPKPIEGEQFPFLIVRPRTGQDTEQGANQNATATFEIIVGIYSDTDDGWIDVVLLIDAIRGDLNAEPAIRNTAFEQTGPMVWSLDEQQPRPQWLGSVTTSWTIPRARRVAARNPGDHHDH